MTLTVTNHLLNACDREQKKNKNKIIEEILMKKTLQMEKKKLYTSDNFLHIRIITFNIL